MRQRLALLLVLFSLCGASVEATTRVAIADNTLTTAATWAAADATGTLISTSTGTTALTTGNLDSATFTPGAITVNGFLVRLGSRAAGSPSNTITVTLRNSTDAVNVQACTINVSLLPASSTANDEGGWFYCHFSSSSLLIAAKAYLIRATLSATTTAVSLCTNGTANNWQHILVTTTTAAPAAGDDMYVNGWFDNAANPITSLTTRLVTMDQTAATDYGSANTNGRVPALAISNGGTVRYGTTASTTYVLQLSGYAVTYSGGELDIGRSGSEIPRSSSATMQFDCAADLDFGLVNKGTFKAFGLSRIAGSNIPWVKVSSDAAASATTINTTAQLSAANNDTVLFTSTGSGGAGAESRTMSGDAGATSVTITAGLTAAKSGTFPVVGEVFVLNRNVQLKAVTDGLVSFFRNDSTGVATIDWVRFHAMGTNPGGVQINNTTGTFTMSNSIQDLADGQAISTLTTTSGSISVTWNVSYNCQSSTNGVIVQINGDSLASTITLQHLVIADTRGSSWGLGWSGGLPAAATATIDDIRIQGIGDMGASLDGVFNFNTFSNFYIHSQGNGMQYGAAISNLTFDSLVSVKTANSVSVSSTNAGMTYANSTFAGCGASNRAVFRMAAATTNFRVTNTRIAGSSSFGCDYGIVFQLTAGVSLYGVNFENVTFGGSSPYANLSVGAVADLNGNVTVEGTINATSFGGSGISITTMGDGSWFAVTSPTITDNKIWTARGTLTYSSTTCDTSPCFKITPSSATKKIDSAGRQRGQGFLVPVDNGVAVTITVLVQKDASYNGNQPRLLVKANASVGITDDVVLDTMSIGTGSYETLTGTTATTTAAGVLEFVVDLDGTAGNVYVDSWGADIGPSFNTMGFDYWLVGYPFMPWSVVVPAIGSGLVK